MCVHTKCVRRFIATGGRTGGGSGLAAAEAELLNSDDEVREAWNERQADGEEDDEQVTDDGGLDCSQIRRVYTWSRGHMSADRQVAL